MREQETLEYFIEVMKDIAREVDEEPETVKSAPHFTPNSRLDEAPRRQKAGPGLEESAGGRLVGVAAPQNALLFHSCGWRPLRNRVIVTPAQARVYTPPPPRFPLGDGNDGNMRCGTDCATD